MSPKKRHRSSWSRFRKSDIKRKRAAARKLAVEQVEPRHMMASTQVTLDSDTSTLNIAGSVVADSVSVYEISSGDIEVSTYTDGKRQFYQFDKLQVSAIRFEGDSGNDIFLNLTSIPSYANGGAGDDRLTGGSGDDQLDGGEGDDRLIGNDGNDQAWGGDGNDVLQGQDGSDSLFGGAGTDLLYGHQGADTLDGGDDADTLYGGNGDDWLLGGAGDDRMFGEAGNDQLDGNAGDDRLEGSEGNDLIYGGDGSDVIHGQDGNDTLRGQNGNDLIYGEAGDDILSGEAGSDTLYGGDGIDWLSGGLDDDRLYGEGDRDRIEGDEGNDRLEGGAGNDLIYGGDGDDVINGNDGNDTLRGQSGNDLIYGDEGNDVLTGEDGSDTIYGGNGTDLLRGGLDDDRLYGEGDRDQLEGNEGNDRIEGGTGNDLIYGGDGDDSLHGDDGNDTLRGQAGSDLVYGDEGDDVLSGEDGTDTLYGGEGNDLMRGSLGDDRLYGNAGDDRLDGGDGDDRLEGNEGNDVIYGGEGADVIYGHEGRDTLRGQSGDDLIYGGLQNDTISGDEGRDTLYGGDGDDQLSGGDGDDLLYGEADDDQMYGDAGDDRLEGSTGNDLLLGGAGSDVLHGQEGEDEVRGQEGNDLIYGNDGNDILAGDEGDDTLYAGNGDDLLFGGAGGDLIDGGAGNDVVSGGDGDDVLRDESGNDILIGGLGSDSLNGAAGEDILIGGQKTYDEDQTALQALSATWNSSSTYDERVAMLSSEHMQYYLTVLDTVFDDGVVDSLIGGADTDWLFVTTVNAIYDPTGVTRMMDMSEGMTHGSHAMPIVYELPAVEGFALYDSIDSLPDREEIETVTSLLDHTTESSKLVEHLASYQLVRYADVTHTAVASGSWSDPSIWQDGVVPASDARVLIPIGVHVTVNTESAAEIYTLRVDGTLSFDTTTNTELRVDTAVVSHVGRLEMGTVDQPVEQDVSARMVITDNGAIDTGWDPFVLSRGLIAHGSVEMAGAATTAFEEATATEVAGSQFITLTAVPTNWQVGDLIAISGTSELADQDETREIISINGATIEVAPLEYDHLVLSSSLRYHVANLTRNVVIESEGDATDRRGHVMFMHTRDVTIEYVAFNKLGRTDKLVVINDAVVDSNWQLVEGTGTNVRARYAVHFHRNGYEESGTPSSVIGSVVNDSVGWGYVNHSSYVNVSDSVAYNVVGAAYVTETGNEVGSFDGNIAIRMTGSGDHIESRVYYQDFGHGGDGFWLQGPGVSVTNNVVSGAAESAYLYFHRGLVVNGDNTPFLSSNLLDPSIAEGAETLVLTEVPPREFSGNVAYASGVGLDIWYVLRTSTHNVQAVFVDSQFWNNTIGLRASYSHDVVYRNIEVMHDDSSLPTYGFSRNILTEDITFEDTSIIGYLRGIWTANLGLTQVIGGTFANYDNFFTSGPGGDGRTLEVQDVTELDYPW